MYPYVIIFAQLQNNVRRQQWWCGLQNQGGAFAESSSQQIAWRSGQAGAAQSDPDQLRGTSLLRGLSGATHPTGWTPTRRKLANRGRGKTNPTRRHVAAKPTWQGRYCWRAEEALRYKGNDDRENPGEEPPMTALAGAARWAGRGG